MKTKILKTILKFIITIVLIVFLIETFGGKGFIGFIIIVLAFGLYRLYNYRENFIQTLESIETIIWKKPLNKDLWEKKELKNTKVKVKWKKH